MNTHDIQPHDATEQADSAFTDSDNASRNIADTDTSSVFSGWLSSFGDSGDSDSGGGGDSSCGGGCGGD